VSNATARLVKGAIGLIIVIVLAMMVFNWWGDYKTAASKLPSKATTGTVDASGTASGSSASTTTVGVVLIEGLNFRKQPDSAADTLRGFKKGEKVTIIRKKGEWYMVKDSKGVTGWVAAKPQYVKVEK